MPRVSLPWVTQSYSGRTRVASIQRLINLYPEINHGDNHPNDAAQFVLIGAPGTRPFIDLGINDGSEIVHLYAFEGKLFVWSRKAVYQINLKTEAVRRVIETDIGRSVSAAYGRLLNDSDDYITYLWWTDGASGYIANINNGEVSPLSEDDSFLPASSTTYLDGYAIFTRRNTSEFFWSKLKDYAVYDGLDFATAEGFPDHISKIVAFERELWLIGENTTEIWQNVGDQDAPFQRIGNAFIEIGCPFPRTITKLSRDIYFVSHDMKVYRSAAKSYRMQPISMHQGVEHDLYEYGAENAFAFGVSMEGHDFYWLTLPSAKRTWVYDEATNAWHERATMKNGLPATCDHHCGNGRCDGNHAYGRHFINSAVTYLNKTYAGGNGHIYYLDLNYHLDGDEKIMREAVSSPIDLGADQISFNSVETEFQNLCKAACNDKIFLYSSDDQSRTWCNHGGRPLFSTDGKYRPFWTAIGTGRGRALRWRTITDQQIVFKRTNLELQREGRM